MDVSSLREMDVNSIRDNGKDALQRLALQLRSSLKAGATLLRPRPLHKRAQRRAENAWLLCWLLKDLGWLLLCGPLAWPAAIVALVLQAHDVLLQWESGTVAEWVHGLATLCWLTGSSVWMTAQLLFEPEIHKGRASPWYSGSIFTASEDNYHRGVMLMQTIDISVIVFLVGFYAASFWGEVWSNQAASDPTGDAIRQRRAALEDEAGASAAALEPLGRDTLVFGVLTPEVYSKVFIVPWILKDLFWCRQSFIPAILCLLLVTVFMADYLWLFKKWKNLAVLLWTTGTAVWMSNDLVMHEQEMWPMLLSVLFFAVGACILTAALVARPPREEFFRESGSKEEFNPLL